MFSLCESSYRTPCRLFIFVGPSAKEEFERATINLNMCQDEAANNCVINAIEPTRIQTHEKRFDDDDDDDDDDDADMEEEEEAAEKEEKEDEVNEQ
ncbi:hypothetical protein PoB_005534200 [Plakobranchus ocellatus]|uniref:Uncharacterized protein n=1 Tax=Plakobranchus ocellatus TaxID=259542 RepID=A0AAV4CBW8_9GAST|nr:hypothetical protein PoB_005534200 [Plakobranchus ocellatus]